MFDRRPWVNGTIIVCLVSGMTAFTIIMMAIGGTATYFAVRALS